MPLAPHPGHPPAHPQMSKGQQNAHARAAIFAHAKPIFQRITSKTVASVVLGQNVLPFNPLQVGFLKRFVVVVTGTINNTGAGVLTLTPNGVDNCLQNVTFNDFTGNPRHNCSGRALSYVEASKYKRTPGAAQTSDTVSGYGSIVPSNVAPLTIANAGSGTFTRVFEIPIMQDIGKNMAGGLYLGVNNQSTLLNLTLNASPVQADPLLGMYTGTSGTMTNVTVEVFQDYWNNLPKQGGKVLLPELDLETAYMITETNMGLSFAAGQQVQWNYPTYSQILGTYFAFNNGLALNAGSDLTSIILAVSNYAKIREYDPIALDRITRDRISTSFPKGQYALMSREHPLNVDQYPSLQLMLTPSSISGTPYALVTTEILRKVQFLANASGVGGA